MMALAAAMEHPRLECTDVYIKTAVLNVCTSVVTLTSDAAVAGRWDPIFSRRVGGTIFSCIPDPDDDNASFVSYILTSADLFRPPRHIRIPSNRESLLFPVAKIDVRLADNKSYQGEVMACDEHYNIAVIKIKSDVPLQPATLQPFNDSISVSPRQVSQTHSPFASPSTLTPGDRVVVVWRASIGSPDVFVSSATYSLDYIIGSDIKELYKISCECCHTFMKGAPVINCNGHVLGVASKVGQDAVFLPVNVFLKWWNHVLTYGEIRRPWLGMTVANLFTAPLCHLEPIVHNCNVSYGVIVEKVARGSSADFANICADDVICQCDGRSVRSFLEFYELIWDKCGEVVEVKGVRSGSHFVWRLEVKAIKTKILPDILAKKVLIREESTKRGKNKAKGRKDCKNSNDMICLKVKPRKRVMKRKTWSLRSCTSHIKLKDVVLSRNSRRKEKNLVRKRCNEASLGSVTVFKT